MKFPAIAFLLVAGTVTLSAKPPKRTSKPTAADPSAAQTSVSATTAATPSVVIEEPEADFGTIPTTSLKSFTVTLVNKGTAPQTIASVMAPCGCTAVSPVSKTLAPGERLQVPVTFNPHGYWGPVTKDIQVHSSDQARKEFSWHFKMNVQGPIIPQPKVLFLDPEEASEAAVTGDFRFIPTTTALKAKSIRVISTQKDDAPLPVIKEWSQEHGEIKGQLCLSPSQFTEQQRGTNRGLPHTGRLEVTLEDGQMDWVDVRWSLRPIFTIYPQAIAFKGGTNLVMHEKVTVSSRKPFKILGAKLGKSFQVRTEPVVGSDVAWATFVQVETSPNLPPGIYNDQLVLTTDNPKSPVLLIPLTASIQ